MGKLQLSTDQRLLINMLLGKAVSAILTKVDGLSDEAVAAMIADQEQQSALLLDEMKKLT